MQTKDTTSKRIYKKLPLHPNPILAERQCTETFVERFWKKVTKTDSCWIWNATKDRSGYGWIGVGGSADAKLPAHAASWLIHNGNVKKGTFVCHNCPGGDNPSCVNPDHLWLGNALTNNRDTKTKGRNAVGSKHGSSKLCEKDIQEIRRLYSTKEFSQTQIAKMFHIGQDEISRIINHKRWTHVHPPAN